MQRILSILLFRWLEWTAMCTLSKNCPPTDNSFPKTLHLRGVYRQSMCCQLKQIASNVCSNCVMSPINKVYYLQLGRKHNLSSRQTKQHSLLTMFNSYPSKKIKRLSFEEFAKKLGLTCNFTAAIWLLNLFRMKRDWKTIYHHFLYKPTTKGKKFRKLKFHVTMNKKRKILLIWKCHATMTKKMRI